MNTTNHPRLKRHFAVIPHSNDVVELRFGTWNATSLTLRDETDSGALYAILSRLDGTRSVESVAREARVSRSDAEHVIDELLALDLVELGASNALDAYLDQATAGLARSEPRITPARPVTIVGSGALASELTAILAADGLATDVEYARPSDELARPIVRGDASWLRDGLELESRLAPYREWRNRVIVFATEQVNPIGFAVMNRIALHHGISWLHAAIDGPFLLVGPAFIPRRTACYECFERRVAMNLREQASYGRYKTLLAEAKTIDASNEPPAAIRSILASHAALETVNLVRNGNSLLAGKVLTIYLPTLEFVFNEVLRVPGCTACSPAGERDDSENYFDMEALFADVAAERAGGSSSN